MCASSTRSPHGSCSRWPDLSAWAYHPRPSQRSQPAPWALLDVDDTLIKVHGHAKQCAGVQLADVSVA